MSAVTPPLTQQSRMFSYRQRPQVWAEPRPQFGRWVDVSAHACLPPHSYTAWSHGTTRRPEIPSVSHIIMFTFFSTFVNSRFEVPETSLFTWRSAQGAAVRVAGRDDASGNVSSVAQGFAPRSSCQVALLC